MQARHDSTNCLYRANAVVYMARRWAGRGHLLFLMVLPIYHTTYTQHLPTPSDSTYNSISVIRPLAPGSVRYQSAHRLYPKPSHPIAAACQAPREPSSQHSADQRFRALCPGRRVWQPGEEPDGVVPQPGDPGAGAVLAPPVPSLLGPDAHPGQPGRPVYAVGLSHPGPLRRGDSQPALRHCRHQRHLAELRSR